MQVNSRMSRDAVGYVKDTRQNRLSDSDNEKLQKRYNNIVSCEFLWIRRACDYTGWPKNVSHYQVSSLSRTKNRHQGYFFKNCDNKMSNRI